MRKWGGGVLSHQKSKMNDWMRSIRCWVSGYGRDDFVNGKFQTLLKKVDVPIVDSDVCEARLKATRLTDRFQLSRSSFICAGGELGKDACKVIEYLLLLLEFPFNIWCRCYHVPYEEGRYQCLCCPLGFNVLGQFLFEYHVIMSHMRMVDISFWVGL